MPRAHPRMGTVYRQRMVLVAVLSMLQAAALAVTLYASQWYWKQPYHNSSLTGAGWVEELIYGHPERIHNCLGMHVHVFLALVSELQLCGLKTLNISHSEKTAIFLYICVTGLSI
jgi:hypothetical protein